VKSHVSDQIELAELVYTEATARCIADFSDLRDLQTIRSRVEQEGLSFLTITLPDFAKDFERSLAVGKIEPESFRGFRKNRAIPAFLQGMLALLFDRETGRLYEQSRLDLVNAPSVVDSVRQICLTFKKLELDCTPERVQAAIDGFVQTEHVLSTDLVQASDRDEFHRVSLVLWSSILANISIDTLRPKHGPGATAERVSGNQKYRFKYWHDRIEPYFPLIDSAYFLSAGDSEEVELVSVVPPEEELPVRVTPVPKTLKGPRIIAIEPCCMQYAQQAIRAVLYERIEGSRVAGGHVNFDDQSVNRELALIASRTGKLATIDLSEASDRVPRDLALSMFDSNPDLRDAIDACRSTHAQLPDGTVLGPLNKFASMGSALCFPVESMYFYTICVAALLRIHNLPVTHDTVYTVSRDVYVYGDDIIVPSKHAKTILGYLQKYNCKVNVHKTFWNGKFRESCGMDAYDGYPVSPVYLRKPVPEDRRQADRLVSWIDTANQFYKKGYWRTSSYMFNICERYLGNLPYLPEDSAGLGRHSFEHIRPTGTWNEKYQRLEVVAWVAQPVYRTDELDGYAALQKSLTRLEDYKKSLTLEREEALRKHRQPREPQPEDYLSTSEPRDPLHLKRSARHGVVALKRRRVPST